MDAYNAAIEYLKSSKSYKLVPDKLGGHNKVYKHPEVLLLVNQYQYGIDAKIELESLLHNLGIECDYKYFTKN